MTRQPDLRPAYVDLCRSMDLQYFVTLVTNRDGTMDGIRRRARDYCARMDRKLLGHLWHKRPATERTDGVFFIEHVASNIHLHGLLRFPSGNEEELRMTSEVVWKKICPSGSVRLTDTGTLPDAVRYCTKEFLFPDYSDAQIVFLRELMSEAAHQTI